MHGSPFSPPHGAARGGAWCVTVLFLRTWQPFFPCGGIFLDGFADAERRNKKLVFSCACRLFFFIIADPFRSLMRTKRIQSFFFFPSCGMRSPPFVEKLEFTEEAPENSMKDFREEASFPRRRAKDPPRQTPPVFPQTRCLLRAIPSHRETTFFLSTQILTRKESLPVM